MIKVNDLGGFSLVDSCNSIDVDSLISAAYKGLIRRIETSGIVVDDVPVKIVSSCSKKGVRRWYFECPISAERCRKLYRHPISHRFGSRRALGLRYRKQAKKGMPENV